MNRSVFSASSLPRGHVADAANQAGGKAYSRSGKEALAQYALTGTIGDTYYASAIAQLDKLIELLGAPGVTSEYVSKLAIYARREGYMKDVPAFLVAWLGFRNASNLKYVFERVIDNGKMIRNVVEACRSGKLGRKTIPRPLRRLIANWLCSVEDERLVAAIPGDKPSLKDILRMVHPHTTSRKRNSFFTYLLGKEGKEASRPEIIEELEKFREKIKKGKSFAKLPEGIPFQLVDSLPLTDEHWTALAADGNWHFTRMNLNTFARHGVFKDKKVTRTIADRLRDAEAIAKAKVFPYQLLAAYLNTADEAGGEESVPREVRDALQDAMELAIKNVPFIEGSAVVLVDVSGSMSSPVTGTHGRRQASKVRCIDVAALYGAAVLRRNSKSLVIPYDTSVHAAKLNGRDSVMTNAQKLAAFGGGGTATAEAMAYLNRERIDADAVIIVSDNESWADSVRGHHRGTALMQQWEAFRRRNKEAKLVCLDLTPEENVQAKDRKDVLNVGGFSDNVWHIINDFLTGDLTPEHLVGTIEKIELK